MSLIVPCNIASLKVITILSSTINSGMELYNLFELEEYKLTIMAKFTYTGNKTNTPREQFLIDLSIAFADRNLEFLFQNVADDIHWEIIGDNTISGKSALVKAMVLMATHKTEEMIIHNIITDGNKSALNGSMKLKSGRCYHFADFYTFESPESNVIKKFVTITTETEG